MSSVAAPKVESKPKTARPTSASRQVKASVVGARAHALREPLPAFARRGEGAPLDASQRQRFESLFRRDFSDVRVYTNAVDRVQQLSAGAQAVTLGHDIYVKTSSLRSPEGEALLAHELTHVAQQDSASSLAIAPAAPSHDPLELEARRNVVDFRYGRPLHVSRTATALRPQAEEDQNHGWFYDQAVALVPAIGPILDRGFFNWIGDRVAEIAASVMESIRAPLDTLRGIETSVSTHVSQLIDWVKKCVAALAKGDCSVLHEGIDSIEHAIDGLTAPAFDALKAAFEKVSVFFNGLWERYGAPLWSKIKDYAGLAWQKIEQFLGWVREKIQPLIDRVIAGWRIVKSWLGIGDDPDGQNGLLQWAQRKLEALWERVKTRLEPIKKPLLVVAGILVMLSPAGPIIAIGAAIGGVIEAIRWIRRTFAAPNGVVSARQMLQQVILPQMIAAITALAHALADKASLIVGKLAAVKQHLDEAAAALSDSLISFLAPPIRFVSGLFASFVSWANEKLNDFVGWVNSTATRLGAFLLTIVDALGDIAHSITDLMRIPLMLAGRLWNKIPACIRDPFVDFLGVQILGRIPIFQAIAGTPEAWARTREDVRGIIHAIFVDFDLIGAMKKTFNLMLRVLNVPPELLQAVLAKMAQAWDVIKSKPAQFLKNLFKTIVLSFKGFFSNILTHLGHGIVGWLTAQLEGTNVQLPQNWTDLGQIFSFVASVLGLSLEHVFQLMEQKVPREVVQVMRTAVNLFRGAWEWLALIVRGDFAAFWQHVKDKLANLKDMVVGGVVSWVVENVVEAIAAQLLTAADPTGISEAITLIIDLYSIIKSVQQYMRPILEMVQRMLDGILNIAAGTLQPAADIVEAAMDRGMPIVIGFLANLARLGNAGEGIKNVIKGIRERVDTAILWLIDKAKAAIDLIVSAARSVASAVTQWWRQRFATRIGGEEHTVTAHGDENSAEIYIESAPRQIAAYLDDIEARPERNAAACLAIRTKLAEIRALRDAPPAPEKGAAISTKMQEIATLLENVLPGVPQSTDPVYAASLNNFGRSVAVARLTANHPIGSVPSIEGPLWRTLVRRKAGGGSFYVRGHLLNHNLGGSGSDERNLTPLTQQANSRAGDSMSRRFEEPLKAATHGVGATVSDFAVTAFYGRTPRQLGQVPRLREEAQGDPESPKALIADIVEAERYVPTRLECSAQINGQPVNAPVDNDIDDSSIENYRVDATSKKILKHVNLSSSNPDDARAFDAVYGIGPTRAASLIAFNATHHPGVDGSSIGESPVDRMTTIIRELHLPADIRTEWTRRAPPVVDLTGVTEWQV